MSVEEIAALPVSEMAEADAHLYLWTTNKYLPAAFSVVTAWGFRYSTPLVWCKRPIGSFLGGAFTPSAEFVLFARRGKLPHLARAAQQWFEWPRQGQGRHSQKPDAFGDLVEQVSPGPYLELFARRQRLGWDTWGNEALNHVEMVS
jgi:N6-adenosine-specific RNA methylase IME4